MITKPKGTIDIYGDYAKKWQYINHVIDDYMSIYNYGFIRTPIFEATELFHRGVGETTDIVTKETYDFIDRGDRNITLRPEGTAGVVRSYIENKMYGDANQPIKLYYNGTMYRYERPQSGRDRELSQFGMEILGSNDPMTDAEIISLAINIYKSLGLQKLIVKINSLGDSESRNNYKEALINYFRPHINELCEDCQVRINKNPLRILDCKIDHDLDILKNAPKTIDYLNEESKSFFDKVLNYLDILDITYELDPKLVRGLDYYNHTVFEIVAETKNISSNNVIGGGGRYNGLVKELGGPDTPCVGIASGIGRIIMAMESEEVNVPINNAIDAFVMYVNDEERIKAIELVNNLRLNGFITEIDYLGRNLKSQFKQGDRLNTKYFIILNSEDLKNDYVNVKDNTTKEETKVKIHDLIDYLDLNI